MDLRTHIRLRSCPHPHKEEEIQKEKKMLLQFDEWQKFFCCCCFFALKGGKRNTLRWKIHRDTARFLLYGKPPLVWLHPLNWMKLNTIRGKPCADNCANRNVWLARSGHKVWCGCWLVCRRHLRINLNAVWGSIEAIGLFSLGVICTRRLTIAC